jgi:hypothetical protein
MLLKPPSAICKLTLALAGVLEALREHGFGGTISVRHGQAGGIVAAIHDTEARGDLVDGLVLESLVGLQIILGLQRRDVGSDTKRHGFFP